MTAYEILLSESQERMLMVIKPEHWENLAAVLEKWQLAYGVIGRVTDTGRVQIVYQDRLEVDVPVAPLTDRAPLYSRPIKARVTRKNSPEKLQEDIATKIVKRDVRETFLDILKDTAEKPWIYDQYDHHIGTKTVLGPEGQGAAVQWIRSDLTTDKPYLGVSMATACHERYCYLNPRLGAAHAVLKSARMIAATGGEPLAITDCLNFGNPENEHVMWEFSEGVDGISDACQNLEIPVVSGNVSFYNETDGSSIYPTPMIGMVGKIDDVRNTPPSVFMNPGYVFLIYSKKMKPSFAGSLVEKIVSETLTDAELPEIHWQAEREIMQFLRKAISQGLIETARDVGGGGIAGCLAKMCSVKGFGFELKLGNVWSALGREASEPQQKLLWYLGEVHGAYIVSVSDESLSKFKKLVLDMKDACASEIGKLVLDETSQFLFEEWSIDVKDIQRVLDPRRT